MLKGSEEGMVDLQCYCFECEPNAIGMTERRELFFS